MSETRSVKMFDPNNEQAAELFQKVTTEVRESKNLLIRQRRDVARTNFVEKAHLSKLARSGK